MTIHVEASGDSEMRITLTDEVLPSLPLYVSRVRAFEEQPELEAIFKSVKQELRIERSAL